MPGHFGIARVKDEALAASATETIVQIVAATNHRVKVVAWGVYFAGTSVTAQPVQATLQKQTSAGTSSALTVEQWQAPDDDTFDTAALQDFTAEPTKSGWEHPTRVHPQAGYEIWFPEGKEPTIEAGGRAGVEVITPAGVNPNCTAFIVFEE